MARATTINVVKTFRWKTVYLGFLGTEQGNIREIPYNVHVLIQSDK